MLVRTFLALATNPVVLAGKALGATNAFVAYRALVVPRARPRWLARGKVSTCRLLATLGRAVAAAVGDLQLVEAVSCIRQVRHRFAARALSALWAGQAHLAPQAVFPNCALCHDAHLPVLKGHRQVSPSQNGDVLRACDLLFEGAADSTIVQPFRAGARHPAHRDVYSALDKAKVLTIDDDFITPCVGLIWHDAVDDWRIIRQGRIFVQRRGAVGDPDLDRQVHAHAHGGHALNPVVLMMLWGLWVNGAWEAIHRHLHRSSPSRMPEGATRDDDREVTHRREALRWLESNE